MSDPISPLLTGDVAWWLALLRAILDAFRPTLDVVVPGLLAWAAHRYIANKQVADAFATGAGVAYNHLSAQYARNGNLDFENAKAAAVSAGVFAVTQAAKSAVAQLDGNEVTRQVDGALGRLLSHDPTFSATGPVTPGVVVNSVGVALTSDEPPAATASVGAGTASGDASTDAKS